jgi:formiminoglutamase
VNSPQAWLAVHHGDAPLIVSFPHTGTEIPPDIEEQLVSPWLARKDADYWVDVLYDFAKNLGATTIRTSLSRTVIDVNRDPTGASLYPGQTTTGLCPLETFDGEPLYPPAREPDAAEIERRRAAYFDPYHAALAEQIARLHAAHGTVVVYDAHSIRSRVPRLFDGELPLFNIGTNRGSSCDSRLTTAIIDSCEEFDLQYVVDGRFRGGWITRHYGQPQRGVHAVQMELAMRGYLREPGEPLGPDNWPTPFDNGYAGAHRVALLGILGACLHFARSRRP